MRNLPRPAVVGAFAGLTTAVLLISADPASAAQPPVGLGVATSFVVLGGSTVTNTGPSVLNGDVGVSPGSAMPGINALPGPATVNGTQHINDGVAANAQLDLTTAYNDAAGRTPQTSVAADLTGRTLNPGVYTGGALGLSGSVTLNGHNDPAAVFIFKAASTLITASNSRVALIGVNPCNVYWQIGSSATLGTNSRFVGTVMALTSISATTGATVQGRLLARTGAVTLDTNTITRPICTTVSTTTAPAPGSSTAGGPGSSSPAAGGPGGPGTPLQAPPTSGTPTGPSPSTPLQPPRLARTGSDNTTLAVGGVLAIIVGGLIVFVARRRIVPGDRHH
jgi:LPXTG-motif cell wall-anchored protein